MVVIKKSQERLPNQSSCRNRCCYSPGLEMESLDAVFNTLKEKIRDKHLLLKVECQSQANKIEIRDLTAEMENARADIDLQQDRLDNYSSQLELENTLREGLGQKVEKLENTVEKLETTVQTLVAAGQ